MNAMVQSQSTSLALVPQSMDEAMRVSEFMAKASLMPDHLRGKPGDCLLVIMQAQRWGMDALSVAQCTAVVKGKLCYEGKLVSAVLMSMGVIKEELDYEYSGTGANRKITVTGTLARSGKTKTIEGTFAQWKTSNDAWVRDTDQMLSYRGARQWARRHAPSAMLGVYTPDEMEDVSYDGGKVTVTNVVDLTPKERAAPVEKAQDTAKPVNDDVVDGDFTDTNDQRTTEEAANHAATAGSWSLGDGQKRLLLAKGAGKGLNEADMLRRFPSVTPSTINDALTELQKLPNV